MNKKYFFLGLTIFAISVFLFSTCQKLNPEIPIPEIPILELPNPEPILVSDLILNKNELILEVGKTETLIATIYPENATNKKLTWYSDNPGSVTVNNDGLVTAINKGTATITVTAEEGGNYKQAKCYIKVGDYRAKWVGSYECEAVYDDKNPCGGGSYHKEYQAIVDVSVSGDSSLYISERNPNPQQSAIKHTVKVHSDGKFSTFFKLTEGAGGYFVNDSIYAFYGSMSAGCSLEISYQGKKIKN
ncbi:MAG: Ig-like domain-containing protein [Bacteroidales bacterium]|jgi:hypothetical protein|nr:Ig-like domain-containing protein [Bacteroidales bacterium]